MFALDSNTFYLISVAPQKGEVTHRSRPPPLPASAVIQRPYRHHDQVDPHQPPPRHPQHGTVSNRLPPPDQVRARASLTIKTCPRLHEPRPLSHDTVVNRIIWFHLSVENWMAISLHIIHCARARTEGLFVLPDPRISGIHLKNSNMWKVVFLGAWDGTRSCVKGFGIYSYLYRLKEGLKLT